MINYSLLPLLKPTFIPHMEQRTYLQTWKKYLPVIRLHLKRSLNEDQSFKLNITDFESAGDRGKSGYTFNLQMENGKPINNISGSAVARDLYEALKADEATKALASGGCSRAPAAVWPVSCII